MDLDYIQNRLKVNIFNFEYNFEPISVNGKEYNKDMLEKAFIEYYFEYQIGYSTLTEFLFRLRRRWLSNIDVLHQRLELYPREQLSLNEIKKEKEYKLDSDSKYSDTPNEKMFDDTNGYLTDRTLFNSTQKVSENEKHNEISKYADLYAKLKDVMYEWFKTFECLFITDVILSDFI